MTDEQRTAKIILFTGVTRLDLSPDTVLEQAKGKMDGIVILGWAKSEFEGDEPLYFASSYADGGTVLWLLEQCKKTLLG